MNILRISLLAVAISAAAPLHAAPAVPPASPGEDTRPHVTYVDQSLTEIADDLRARAGIDVRVSESLKHMQVSVQTKSGTWKDIIEQAFAGLNTVVVYTPSGEVYRVYVLGVGESPADLAGGSATEQLWQMKPTADHRLPPAYSALRPGAIHTLDVADLQETQAGDRIRVALPGGDATLVVKQSYAVEGGLHSVNGYFEEFGEWHTAHISAWAEGHFGTLITPYGELSVDTYAGTTYLVDMNTGGAINVMPTGDGETPPVTAGMGAELAAAGAELSAQVPSAGAASGTGGVRYIDVLVYYTANVNGQEARARYLVDFANSILTNSQSTFRFRAVGVRPVNYGETTTNTAALHALADNMTVFAGTEALRTQLGADLVTLLRPFRYPAQGDCGRGFLLGYQGSALNARWGYSVVSDGVSGGYYCATQTMAHEFGHNLGNAHDHNDPLKGHRSDSHGHFVAGSFGTVMSYAWPRLSFFSNPALTCKNDPCGIAAGSARAANAVASMETTAPKVVAFRSEPSPSQADTGQDTSDSALNKARAQADALQKALNSAKNRRAALAKATATARAHAKRLAAALPAARADVARLTRARVQGVTLTTATTRVASITKSLKATRAKARFYAKRLTQARADVVRLTRSLNATNRTILALTNQA